VRIEASFRFIQVPFQTGLAGVFVRIGFTWLGIPFRSAWNFGT